MLTILDVSVYEVRKAIFAGYMLIACLLFSHVSEAGQTLKGKGDNKSLSLTRYQVVDVMEQVADWQIFMQSRSMFRDRDWTNATFCIGLMGLTGVSTDEKYVEWLKALGGKYAWQPAFSMYVADDIAISQMYLDMYMVAGDERMFNPTQARTEWVVSHPSNAHLNWGQGYNSIDRWSWCDALFMAPPVYVKMYNITKEDRFLEFMDKEYRVTYDLLYDKKEHLFFRDYRYFDKREKNGEKVFWGRGNGWVLGGLVKILQEMPTSSKYYPFYQDLFVEMCERIGQFQDENGYWRTSLLDPEAYPNPETSGSSFYVYALAYGVNAGLLDREKYLPIVEKGWKALERAVLPDGKLGWVQPIGAAPGEVAKNMTEVYGAGAFLLAGCEVYHLCNK